MLVGGAGAGLFGLGVDVGVCGGRVAVGSGVAVGSVVAVGTGVAVTGNVMLIEIGTDIFPPLDSSLMAPL